MTKRDHCTEDCTNIYDVPMDQMRPIYSKSVVACGCCKKDVCPFRDDEKIYKWVPRTTIRKGSKLVTVYCEDCLKHFGAVTCPYIRGVPAFKTSKKIKQ
jgi:hypothetical protein